MEILTLLLDGGSVPTVIKITMNKITFKDKQKTLFERLKTLRGNPTESELKFKKILDSLKVKYIFQKGFIKGDAYVIVDFYLPKPYKICVEIDGKYHENQKGKDKWRDDYLRSRGFTVIRIKNENLNNITYKNTC